MAGNRREGRTYWGSCDIRSKYRCDEQEKKALDTHDIQLLGE